MSGPVLRGHVLKGSGWVEMGRGVGGLTDGGVDGVVCSVIPFKPLE